MRTYRSNDRRNTCMHVIGNGEVMVALRGLDIYQARGNHLAGRNCLSGTVSGDRLVESVSERIRGRDRWQYRIRIDGSDAGGMEEYLTVDHAFVRDFTLNQPLSFLLYPDSEVLFDPQTGVYTMPRGAFYVNDYPTDRDVCFRVYGDNVDVRSGEREITVTVQRNSRLIVRFGETPESVLEEAIGNEYNAPCPPTVPTALGETVEDYWYVYANYRSVNGGVASAVEWNLAYIRDLYGASRGLLAAGFYEQARELLRFYQRVWTEKGFLATAQSVGTDGAMHIHECDETENPGYLILQAFDYRDATGDEAFFAELLPMLTWALEKQVGHLYQGMMPFSGDETYVAGGMMPKVHLEDGSCESTMLLIESGRRMQAYEQRPEILACIQDARHRFRENFVRNGRLMTNNPLRAQAPKPATKKGVCVYCYRYMDGLKPNRYGLYTCPDCSEKTEDLSSDKTYRLSCVEMMPAYIHSDLLTLEEQRVIYEDLARDLIARGSISGNGAAGKCTGYEYGLLLYGLTTVESPLRHAVYQMVLDARDEEGIWAEYYADGKPAGMRWRVWEGGVNLMALLTYEAMERRIQDEAMA